MEYDILVTKQPNNGYIARPILLPEVIVAGQNEAEALTRVREAIANVYTQSHIVRVDVPIPDEIEADPWLRFAGMWGDDERWAQFSADIALFRQVIDEQTQANVVD